MPAVNNFTKPALLTGLLAGTLDLSGAVISFIISNGRFPGKILEYIASAAFGKQVINGSISSNLWGAFFHYFIAISFSFFYFLIYHKIKFLQHNVFISAVVYGLFAWAVTNMIVLPLSALHSPVIPVNYFVAAKAAVVLVICIGLPITFFAKKFYSR
jgi:hypothetical protein